jgi:hypothetical protein
LPAPAGIPDGRPLTALTYPGGAKVFAPGSKLMAGHLPLQLSYKATEGTGFRQIWWAPRPNSPSANRQPI